MKRVVSIWMVAAALSLAGGVPGISAQSLVKVTVQDLFNRNHQIVVGPRTEVIWADPHFERVWFPAGRSMPQLRRSPDGYHAVFTTPGTYRGNFTVVIGHGSNEIYPMTVTVRGTK